MANTHYAQPNECSVMSFRGNLLTERKRNPLCYLSLHVIILVVSLMLTHQDLLLVTKGLSD